MKYGEIKAFARMLRKNPTPAEALLWKYLRNKQLMGRKFLRQHPLSYQLIKDEYYYYIPDFYCYRELLIIELDGRIHDFQIEKDKNRQEILEHTGFRVLRFKNEELIDIKKVLKTISEHFKE